jgi:hypothetical protein
MKLAEYLVQYDGCWYFSSLLTLMTNACHKKFLNWSTIKNRIFDIISVMMTHKIAGLVAPGGACR